MSGWESVVFGLIILAVLLHTFFCIGRILYRIGFRVRPKTSYGIAEFSQHEAD